MARVKLERGYKSVLIPKNQSLYVLCKIVACDLVSTSKRILPSTNQLANRCYLSRTPIMLLHVLLFFLLSGSAVATGTGVRGIVPEHNRDNRLRNGVYRPKAVFSHSDRVHRYATGRMLCRAHFPLVTVSRMTTLFVRISCHTESTTRRMG
jgi:hypothetical protein